MTEVFLPNPEGFGTTRAEFERLGRALAAAMLHELARTGMRDWTEVATFRQLARKVREPIRAGSVFLDEAIRLAAIGNRYKAGRHYRAYYECVLAEIRQPGSASHRITRQWRSTKGNYRIQQEKFENAAAILMLATALKRKNKFLKQTDLATLIRRETSTDISERTIRRYLKEWRLVPLHKGL